jgi:hypothetical protein
MLTGLTLSLQQLSSLALQLCRPKLQARGFLDSTRGSVYEVIHFFFQRLDEVVSHGVTLRRLRVGTIMRVVSLGQCARQLRDAQRDR